MTAGHGPKTHAEARGDFRTRGRRTKIHWSLRRRDRTWKRQWNLGWKYGDKEKTQWSLGRQNRTLKKNTEAQEKNGKKRHTEGLEDMTGHMETHWGSGRYGKTRRAGTEVPENLQNMEEIYNLARGNTREHEEKKIEARREKIKHREMDTLEFG